MFRNISYATLLGLMTMPAYSMEAEFIKALEKIEKSYSSVAVTATLSSKYTSPNLLKEKPDEVVEYGISSNKKFDIFLNDGVRKVVLESTLPEEGNFKREFYYSNGVTRQVDYLENGTNVVSLFPDIMIPGLPVETLLGLGLPVATGVDSYSSVLSGKGVVQLENEANKVAVKVDRSSYSVVAKFNYNEHRPEVIEIYDTKGNLRRVYTYDYKPKSGDVQLEIKSIMDKDRYYVDVLTVELKEELNVGEVEIPTLKSYGHGTIINDHVGGVNYTIQDGAGDK